MLPRRLLLQHIFGVKNIRFLQFQKTYPALSTSLRRTYEEVKENAEEEGLEEEEASFYADVPRPGRKWERKPYPTPMKVLIQRAKEERRARQENPCRVIERAPDNGLLVPHLIDVAHQVYRARELMLLGLSKLLDGDAGNPVKKCRFCSEVHIGLNGHEIRTCDGPRSASRSAMHVWRRGGMRDVIGFPYCYHLYDRVGTPRVGHKERFGIQRVPAVVELCIQAGLDLAEYATKRRTKPVYSIEGRIVDFEAEKEEYSVAGRNDGPVHPSLLVRSIDNLFEEDMTLGELSSRTLRYWFEMRSGAMKIMEEYSVITCGYCPEVQVGPKGHKVRMCKAVKHQFRNGLHAWQEATIDDLIRPNYVWHVREPHGPPLANELKRYYGKAPAIVELCIQAGAPVPIQYRSMMRLDVVPPARDEYDLVT